MGRSDKNSERAHRLADDLTGHLLRSVTEPAAVAALLSCVGPEAGQQLDLTRSWADWTLPLPGP